MSQSEYLNRPDAKRYLKVCELLREWDPIGVFEPGSQCPLDEYDSYAPQIIRLLNAGGNETQVARELGEIAYKAIGVSTSESPTAEDLAIAKNLVAFWREWKT